MKKDKILATWVATVLVLSLGVSSIYAYGWNGGWWRHWKLESHNPWDLIVNIDKQEVNATEIDLLKKQYEEEMMANELYTSFYEKYWIETFKKIAESESKHMEAVKVLLDRYDIDIPSNYDHIQDLYDTLKEEWSKSEFDALEVWVKIEFVDIDDIITAIKSTDNDDIKVIFTNIWGASYNHLRWFLKAIDSNDYETELDWSKYLDESDLSIKGPIKYKLAEELESQWVDLPEQVNSDSMKNKKCDKEWKKHWNKWWDRKWKFKNWWGEKWNRYTWTNDNWINNSLKAQYKNNYEAKYGSVIAKMSDSKLNNFIEQIDLVLERIKIWNYSNTLKVKYSAMLSALKEIALENLEEILDFDSLFN